MKKTPRLCPSAWLLLCAFVVMLRLKASIAAEDDLVISLNAPLQADLFAQMTDEQWDANLERLVFQNVVVVGNVAVGGRVVGAGGGRLVNQHRSSIDAVIEQKIRGIAEEYNLNQEKKDRLRLAAQADKLRCDREFDEIRRRFRTLPKTQANVTLIYNEASVLGQKTQSFLGPESFFAKASKVILTGESPKSRSSSLPTSRSFGSRTVTVERVAFAPEPPKLPHDETEELRLRHRGNVECAVREFNWRIGMKNVQRQKLIELLLRETKVPTSRGDFDDIAVKYRFSEIPEDKLKPLFEEGQWPRVVPVINGYREFKPVLVRHGMIDADGRFPEQPADAATPVNRGDG